MAVVSTTPDVRGQWREVGQRLLTALAWLLYGCGWLTARGLRGIAWSVAATFYGVGWIAGRALWPAACWAGRAAALGWREGVKPSRP